MLIVEMLWGSNINYVTMFWSFFEVGLLKFLEVNELCGLDKKNILIEKLCDVIYDRTLLLKFINSEVKNWFVNN